MTATSTDKPPGADTQAFVRSDKPWVLLRGIAGGIVGGIAGYFLFSWLSSRGAYGYAIPGALIGLGAGLAARGRSQLLGILCAVAAACLLLFAEWKHGPFKKDPTFVYFVTHLHQLDLLAFKAVVGGLGIAFAYWLGQGRELP